MEQEPEEITQEAMAALIENGAEIIEFQNFLGGERQVYTTVVMLNDKRFVCYHKSVFPFIRQKNGKLIHDKVAGGIPACRNYHPS